MKIADQLRSSINAAIGTLVRRHGSSADDAERPVILVAIEELNAELTLLNQAALLQVASSIASATDILERAVAAARLGPFDGYLQALESHLTQLNRLSGKAHAGDGLESAAVRPTRGKPVGRTRAAQAHTGGSLESFTQQHLTSTSFAELQQEYQDCFERCVTRQEFAGNVAYYVKRLRHGQPNYQRVEREIAVPWVFVGIIHGMECGFNFAAHLHNGDPLTARTVRVPKGRPKAGVAPFTWLHSALDALRLKKLDQVRDWSVPHMLYLLESYNGFGYRRKGLPSPYLWSFSNLYGNGKFVQDGKYDPNAVSKQCGAAVMMKAALES